MQIIVTPNDIIQRCLWDSYKKFCLFDNNEEEIESIIENNKPISLSENDSYVIGLLKVVETDNFVHRFNEDILEYLQIKSSIIESDLFINKSSIVKFTSTYLDKFPPYYKPSFNYKSGLDELIIYIGKLKTNIEQMELVSIENKGKTFTYYKSRDIKKSLETLNKGIF